MYILCTYFLKYELGKGQPFIHSFIQGTRDSFPKSAGPNETGLAVLPRLSCSQVWPCYRPAQSCHLLHFPSGLVHPSSVNLVSPSQEGTIQGQLSAGTWSAPGTAAQGSWAHTILPPRPLRCWDHRLIPPVFFFFVILTLFIVIKNKRYLNVMVNI